ncbi:hypothetical protein CP10139811_1172, partial [Chlamydia ibidis]
SRVFSSRIPHLSKNHAFSLRKSAILGNIMLFLFANPPFMRKPIVFSSEIPHLSENHAFSHLEFHI